MRKRTVAGGDRGEVIRGEDDEVTDWWGQSASGSDRERWRGGKANEWGRRVSGARRERGVGRSWAEGEGVARARGGAAAGVGWIQPS